MTHLETAIFNIEVEASSNKEEAIMLPPESITELKAAGLLEG
jgi:hypothetical protein